MTLRIVIPRPQHRSAHFVSPGARGMKLKFQGPTAVNETVGLTPASNPHCVMTPSGSNCSFPFSLKSGSYTASVSLYDKAPVGGSIPAGAKLLSTLSNAPFTIARGKPNIVGLDLAGVPASFSFIDVPLATAGTAFPTPQHFTVIAKDAGGFVIVGTYQNAITLSDGDTSGATSIATLGADNPGGGKLLSSSDVATIAYTGLAIAPVTITASASGASNGTATFAPTLQPIVVTTNNTINPGFVGVDLYATTGAGSTKNFTVSEIGWTNAPFNKSIGVSGSCSSTASVSPASGTSFTATAGGTVTVGTCTDTLSDGAGQQQPFIVAYSRFVETGGEQDLTLPAGVNQITAIVRGAQGSLGIGSAGGRGAIVTASLPITPLDMLAVFAGGQNGYNGGGNSGTASGGGASDIREGGTALANRIVVAGGGGGGGFTVAGGAGGFNGVDGVTGEFNSTPFPGGGGATQSAGGSNGGDPDGCSAAYTAASLGQGGSVSGNQCPNGGGGGGGYYGGGAGASGSTGAGGGGGSSFAILGAVASFTSDAQAGNGSVTIEF